MNVNLGIWDKLTKLIVVLLFVAGVVGVALWYYPLIKQNERMRQELQQVQAKVKVEEDRNHQLRSQVEAARTSPKTVERMARASLGYARPGEIVIRFEDARQRR